MMLSRLLTPFAVSTSRIGARKRKVKLGTCELEVARTSDGVAEIWADDADSMWSGLGYMHGVDRRLQLILTRLVGAGRLSECLRADDESLKIDRFMRSMDFAGSAAKQAQSLSPELRHRFERYADGISHAAREYGIPSELRMLGIREFETWTVEDAFTLLLLMSYLGLAQTQQDLQKLIYASLAHGAPREHLSRMFAPHLDELDDEAVELLRKVRFGESAVPPEIIQESFAPILRASNNWAVRPSRSASGHTLIAGDPHLEINRLPAIWYEFIGHIPEQDLAGISMPGIPGLIMGRNRDLAYNFTYGYLDMVDYFIEECKNAKVRRGQEWIDLARRDIEISRKGQKPYKFSIYESDIGPLECPDPEGRPSDGFYLSRAFAPLQMGLPETLAALFELGCCRDVAAAQAIAAPVAVSCNWIFADREGNIGYQQSGVAPKRKSSGLIAHPAWDRDTHWKGRLPPAQLHRVFNPSEGFIATANESINPPGGPIVCNVAGADYRKKRIEELFSHQEKITLEDCQRAQADLKSLQAQAYIQKLRPYLGQSDVARLLLDWDCCYTVESRAAMLFEELYRELLHRCWSEQLFGEPAWNSIVRDSYIAIMYFQYFDAPLLGDASKRWWDEETHHQIFSKTVESIFQRYRHIQDIPPWGDVHTLDMHHMLLGDKVPGILGLNRGPLPLPGGRATLRQAQFFEVAGRPTSTGVSFRMVCDLHDDSIFTALAGGPSDRPLSPWYDTDLKRWSEGGYKELSLSPDRARPAGKGRPQG